MIVFPNAKINLGLHVIEKRSDGYHNLQTVFYPIPLCDVLEVIEGDSGGLRFFNYGLTLDVPDDKNSSIKAVQIVADKYDIPPLDIHLYKHIPFGAGLGGGSSDAAHMLILLKTMFKLNISFELMGEMALKLGSDCPFFLHNKAMYATGRGEVLEPIEVDLSGKYLFLIKPPIHISTAEAYKGITPRKPAYDLREILKRPVTDWFIFLQNDFEPPVFEKYPVMQSIKQRLYAMGALYAAMSGSGSTLYGIFNNEVKIPADFRGYFTWVGRLP